MTLAGLTQVLNNREYVTSSDCRISRTRQIIPSMDFGDRIPDWIVEDEFPHGRHPAIMGRQMGNRRHQFDHLKELVGEIYQKGAEQVAGFPLQQ